jgi:hypothetical protein
MATPVDGCRSARNNAKNPDLSGVRVLTFVSYRGGFVYECQNQTDTSKLSFLVRFWI